MAVTRESSGLSGQDSHSFASFDGVELSWQELGEGRPLLLLHGLFSNADVNWIKFGHAAVIADAGFRLIMPDLRGHGASAKPHDRECYPPEVLARDGAALIDHLGLEEYDLGGYSLGGRTAVRMVVMGCSPGRLVVSGMGLDGLVDTGRRTRHFRRILQGLGTFERGTPEWMAETFLKTNDGDPEALLPLLDTFVDTSREELAGISQETLVLCGSEDHDNGSSEELAQMLPNADYREVPGNHMSVITKPAFGRAIADFVAQPL